MSDNIEAKGKIIAFTTVFCIIIIVAGFVIIEINKQSNPQQTENQRVVTNMNQIKNVIDNAYNQGREDAKLIQKANDKKKFIDNIGENIKGDIFVKQRLFKKEYYFTVENKSEYNIEKIMYKVDYYKNVNSYKVLQDTEYINFYNLKSKDRQTKQITYVFCSGWEWKIEQLECSALELDYGYNGKAYQGYQ